MKKVAIYARVSSEHQAQQATVDSQIAALRQRIQADGHTLLPQDIYIDAGISGSTLVRPALERLRDRVAEGAVEILYVHGPDRLARKYAYQVLLLEELRARGVSVVFLHGPSTQSAEDELLVQVQGMIAEYERAKIMERSRRGKLFRARQGLVNAFGRAPYGYLYVRKSDGAPASFQIVLHEAKVVRWMFDALVHKQYAIGAVVRELNEQGIPARCGGRWSKSSVQGVLRNSAYTGKAAFGKTRAIERAPLRIRPLRGKSIVSSRGVLRPPREEWIWVDVPAIISEDLFAAAAEQLERNRQQSQRKARQGTYLLQGLTVCANCGYTFCGTTIRGKGRRPYSYYRCAGNRMPGGRVCSVPYVRVDMLDAHVWKSVCGVLQEPERLMAEWTSRASNDGEADAMQAQCDDAERRLATHERTLQRLVDAYEAGAIDLADLKRRSDAVRVLIERARQDLERVRGALDKTVHLRAIVTRLADFGAQVAHRLETLTFSERQRLVRTLVSKIEIDAEGAVIVFRLNPSVPPTPDPSQGGDGGASYGQRPTDHGMEPTQQRHHRLHPGRRGEPQQHHRIERRCGFGGFPARTPEPGNPIGTRTGRGLRHPEEGGDQGAPELIREVGVTPRQLPGDGFPLREGLPGDLVGIEALVREARRLGGRMRGHGWLLPPASGGGRSLPPRAQRT